MKLLYYLYQFEVQSMYIILEIYILKSIIAKTNLFSVGEMLLGYNFLGAALSIENQNKIEISCSFYFS